MTPAIYADFHNADPLGRLRLNCWWTLREVAALGLELRDGLRVVVRDEELEADAVVAYSAEESIWVAVIDWAAVRHAA